MFVSDKLKLKVKCFCNKTINFNDIIWVNKLQ